MTAHVRHGRRAATAMLLSLVLFGAAACGGRAQSEPAQSPRLTIAMITEWDSGSFWSVVKAGAEQASRELNINLVFNTADGDHEREAQLIATAVTQHVDGIAVSAADPDAIRGAVAQARKAGIPVITLNSGEEESASLGAIGHVGQTETVAGQQAGQRLAQTGARKLLCVNGEPGNIGQVQRCQGAQQGFGKSFEVENVTGAGDIATTLTEIESKLRSDPSIDAVLTLNPDIAIAARDAISGAGSKAVLGTFDMSNDVLTAIGKGQIAFAVDQQPYLQGYLPVVFLNLYHTNGDLVGGGKPVLTGPSFVDRSNVGTVQKLVAQGTR